MLSEELIFAATCDISGHVRGKAFPRAIFLPGCFAALVGRQPI